MKNLFVKNQWSGGGRHETDAVASSGHDCAACLRPLAQQIEKTVRYMLEHLDQPVQVARLAAMANVSPSHYFALFKQHTGWSPIQFFTRLRMQRACGLLEQTSLSVKEVAAALGFDDPFYFSRVFKSHHDIAPSEYRLLPAELKAAEESRQDAPVYLSIGIPAMVRPSGHQPRAQALQPK